MLAIDLGVEASTEIKVLNRRPRYSVESFNSVLERIRDRLIAMGPEAPEHFIYSAAALERLVESTKTAPPDLAWAMNVSCAGLGLPISTNKVYVVQRYVGATLPPGGLPVYVVVDGKSEEALRLDRYGRAGGPFGWDKYRDVVGYVLASFTHNFVVALLGYANRPKTPFSGQWVLPNLVLAETVAPRQAIPPASFAFSLLLPSVRPTFIVEYSSDTPVTLGFELWDAGKNPIARIDSVSIKESGDIRVVVVFRGVLIRRGYFTVDVHEAPYGITLTRVSTIPPSI